MVSDLCWKAFKRWRIDTCSEHDLRSTDAVLEWNAWQAAWQQSRTSDPLIAECREAFRQISECCGTISFSSHNQMKEAVLSSQGIAEKLLDKLPAAGEL